MAEQTRLVICYDGSEGARHAVVECGRLFPGAHATIVYAWAPPYPIIVGGVGSGAAAAVSPELDTSSDMDLQLGEHAQPLTQSAREEAEGVGLRPEVDVRTSNHHVWRELLSAADAHDADLIVAGARGHGGVGALLLGSTAEALVHRSARPVLILRAPESD
jgi:nucleotide-binding universal stress UspA family protein